MVREIREVRRKKGSKRGRPCRRPLLIYIRSIIMLYSLCSKKKGGPLGHLSLFIYTLLSLLSRDYQILIRSSGFLYSLSPGFTSNALYQASIFTGAPIVRYWLGECGSVSTCCASVSGREEPLQT